MQSFLNVISVLAFIMSAISWICTAYNRSINFSVQATAMAEYYRKEIKMQSFLNVISVLAFIMSAISWICTAYNRSINFSVDVKDYCQTGKCIHLYLMMQNNSGKPITISGISIVSGKEKFPCGILSKEIKDYCQTGKCIHLYLMMQNNSGKPITISGISIVSGKEKFPCGILSKEIIGVDYIPLIETPTLPMNFAAYQGLALAFEFSQCSDIELAPDKTVVLEIYTNRKVLRRDVVLGNMGDVLHP